MNSALARIKHCLYEQSEPVEDELQSRDTRAFSRDADWDEEPKIVRAVHRTSSMEIPAMEIAANTP